MPTDDATTTEGVLIDAMARAEFLSVWRPPPRGAYVTRVRPEHDAGLRKTAAVMLAALLVPTVKVDCPTCGGRGWVPGVMHHGKDRREKGRFTCDQCHEGKVTRRALDVWLAEQGDQ